MKRFYGLDALRGIAAMTVMVYHVGYPRINTYGYLAVDLFFMLSGFVLMHAYGENFEARRFAIQRLIRLWPMFAMGLLVGLILNGGSPLGLLFIPSFAPGNYYPPNPALWSVLAELVASFGLAVFFRFGRKAWRYFLLVSSAPFIVGMYKFTTLSTGMGWMPENAVLDFSRLTCSFTIGIGLHWLYQRIGKTVETKFAWLIPVIFVAWTFLPESHLVTPFSIFVLFPALILAGAIFEVPQRRSGSLLGEISYPLYAIHHPLVVNFGWAGVPLTLVGGWIAARYYDAPVRVWLKKKADAIACLLTNPQRQGGAI